MTPELALTSSSSGESERVLSGFLFSITLRTVLLSLLGLVILLIIVWYCSSLGPNWIIKLGYTGTFFVAESIQVATGL